MLNSKLTSKRLHACIGLFLIGAFCLQLESSLDHRATEEGSTVKVVAPKHVGVNVAYAALAPETPAEHVETLEERAAADPMGFFESLLEKYDTSVRDYTCTFAKKELVNGRYTEEQVIAVQFREKPFSVLFKWVKNEDKCSRVLYVADRWIKKDKQMAVVEPGPIARIFVPYVMRQIDGKDAAKSSRRTINQFGLRNSIDLVLKYCRMAEEQGILDFQYVGNGQVNERETLVFERHLPYTGEDGVWPDRVLVVHVDKELLVPTLCLCYGDDAKTKLLGQYMTTDINVNPNLADSVFTKKGMGLE